MTYDCFLFAGHGLSSLTGINDPGASHGGYKESEITAILVKKALDILKPLNINIHTSSNNFSDKDTKNNTYKYKSGLSVHINGGGGVGSEIIVPLGEKYFTPDETLLNSLNSVLGLNNRGLKSRDYNTEKFITRKNGSPLTGKDYYGEIRVAWEDGISLSILEVGFIDSSDINIIMDNLDTIAYFIAEYIASICSKTLPSQTKVYKVIITDLHIKDEAERLLKEFKCRGYNATLM